MVLGSSLNSEDEDPIYLSDGSGTGDVDGCLLHGNGQGTLHYHAMAASALNKTMAGSSALKGCGLECTSTVVSD
jgi:hypothetical protein